MKFFSKASKNAVFMLVWSGNERHIVPGHPLRDTLDQLLRDPDRPSIVVLSGHADSRRLEEIIGSDRYREASRHDDVYALGLSLVLVKTGSRYQGYAYHPDDTEGELSVRAAKGLWWIFRP